MECLASKRNTAAHLFFPFRENVIILVKNKGKGDCLTSDCVLIFIFNWCIYRSNTKTGAKVSELEQVTVLH